MAEELLLTIDVIYQKACMVHGNTRDIVILSFSGTAAGRMFSGNIQPSLAVTQTTMSKDPVILSANFLIRGKDFTGKDCQIFVQHQGCAANRYTPVITTDSPALSDWETSPLSAELEQTPGGVRILIWKTDAHFFQKTNWMNENYSVDEQLLTKKMISFRISRTGVMFYTLYEGETQIATASCPVLPSPPVYIADSAGNLWISEFDRKTTIRPGVSRVILDRNSSKPVARLVYSSMSHFVLNDNIDIYCGDRFYIFLQKSRIIALIRPVLQKPIQIPNDLKQDPEAEPYYEVSTLKDLKTDVLSIIHAFPLLQFFI